MNILLSDEELRGLLGDMVLTQQDYTIVHGKTLALSSTGINKFLALIKEAGYILPPKELKVLGYSQLPDKLKRKMVRGFYETDEVKDLILDAMIIERDYCQKQLRG